MLKRLLFVVCLAYPIIVTAEEPEARWFDIEVLVFKRNQLSAENFEQWPQDPGTPTTDTAASLLHATVNKDADPYDPIPFQLLPENSYQLNESMEKMLASDSYKPLLHFAWRQPTYEKNKALPILIPGGEENEIEGTITVSVKRYLHLAADLLMHDSSALTGNLAATTVDEATATISGMRSYRLTETRRMRSTEVHYFDHPAFGILAVITPYKLPERPAPVPVIETPVPAVTP